MKNKILTTFLIMFFIVITFCTNSVFGVEGVSQGWIITENGQRALVFRTFTGPHASLEKRYYDALNANQGVGNVGGGATWTYGGKNITSKWVYDNDTGMITPATTTFGTMGLAFHTQKICSYPSQTANNGVNVGYNLATDPLTYDVATVASAVKRSSVQYTVPSLSKNYNNSLLYEVMNTTGKESTINWGTGLKVTGLTAYGSTEYRYAIVNIQGLGNVVIVDNIVKGADLTNLIKKIVERSDDIQKTEQGNFICWVSNIVISQTKHSSGGYEVARTADKFFTQYDKSGYGGFWWGSDTRGHTGTKAMGSVINLYDNKLIFPNLSKRNVLVRHINIGTNTTISTSIVKNGTPIKSTNITLNIGDALKILTGKRTSSTKYSTTYQEYYEGTIDIGQKIRKTALPDTNTYKCIGYNVAIENSANAAQSSINTKIKNGRFTKGKTVNIAAKDASDEDDYIVIDFYYSEYEKDVTVNHLYVDKNGYVKEIKEQTIIPNTTAKIGNTTINRKNTDKYIKEVYAKKLGSNVIVRKADSLNSVEKLEYKGYELFTKGTKASSLVGTQRVNLKDNSTATLTSNNIQVNFYYYYDEQVELKEPPKEIEGKVFVSATGDKIVQAECNDTEEKLFNITSIPSGSKAKVGIKEIPRFMVGAITTEYVSPAAAENKINITAEFKMGSQTKIVSYNNLPYRAGYYKITDMAVYKLVDAEVYDAGSEGTIGESLFNWTNGKLKVNPKDMKLNVVLTGINNRTIANTRTSINNVNNYVSVSIKDKYGNESNSANSKVTTVYLTTEQLNEVDLNSDGAVTNEDKKYANAKLKEYEDILKAKQDAESIAQSTYNNKVSKEATLKSSKDEVEKELNRLVGIYNETINKKSEYIQAKVNAYNDLVELENKLETAKGELEELKTILKEQEETKKAADSNYVLIYNEKERLHNEYLKSVSDRNELAANAECNDTVEDDVYIYLEQEEKDALEQCRLAKLAYQNNLDEKVVENALKVYEDYLDTTYKQAYDSKENATNAYNKTLNTDIPNKENEISDLSSKISSQQVLVNTATRELNDYVQEIFRPAKENYESYRDGAYKTAVDNYNEFISQNYETVNGQKVLIALTELNTAKANTKKAQEDRDSYSIKVQTLNDKYNSYKEKYDEFISISGNNKQIAKKLDLKINISVQNMIAKINNELLAKSDKNTASVTYDLYDYMNSDKVPQITTEKLSISKDVYSNIGTTQIQETDYSNANIIDYTKLNGVRTLSGKATYDAIVAIGESNVRDIEDTVYYSDRNTNKDEEITYIFKLKTLRLTKEYKIDTSVNIYNSDNQIDEDAVNEKYKYVDPVNVYTPITVSSKLTTDGNQIIDQTQNNNIEDNDTSVIQVNVPFRIDFDNNKSDGIYKIDNTTKYSKGYYIKFEFDVNNVKINGRKYKNGARIPAGTWIGIITRNKKNQAYIEAQAYSADNANVVSEENNQYTVRAVAYNIPSIIENKVLRFKTLNELNNKINAIIQDAERNDPDGLLDYVNICKHPTYVAEETKNVIIINRVYDFKVTDVKDISWKSVFRKTSGNSTNAHKGILYYSGTTKWNSESEKANSIIRRNSSEIGKNPLRVLPIGPYKNTDTAYIKAPKLGYRFSFDMKVTGAYYSIQKGDSGKATTQVREDKKVEIATKFYYISKDGKKYLKESDGSSKGIYLFYKTSEGKYLRIDNSGGGYNIRFTPNDGYRYIEDSDRSTLSTQSLNLGNLRRLTLTSQMATVTNNQAAITYYGEYKLPNSTIAVEVNSDGSYDINKPLKDGYIGVVFDIYAYTGNVNINELAQDVVLSYSKDTKKDQPNTSQWDYEGFLGYTSYGSAVSDLKPITLKLEKGKWTIKNDTYQEIKGTVMLYDIDQRAATDYE